MEIEHIGDNKIRCALTEQEIESLGYDIDAVSYTHLPFNTRKDKRKKVT